MSLTILSKQTDALGTDVYRSTDSTIPMAFRPSVEMSAALNPKKTSVSMTVKSLYPLVNTVDGVPVSQNQFLMVTKFTALQHVVNDTERAKIFDDHIAFLEAARSAILEGRLPTTAITLA